MNVLFEDEALVELRGWTQSQCRTAAKILELLLDCIHTSPTSGKGKPEALKHGLAGFWSRRIDDKNRLVYHFDEHSIYVLSCKGHYE